MAKEWGHLAVVGWGTMTRLTFQNPRFRRALQFGALLAFAGAVVGIRAAEKSEPTISLKRDDSTVARGQADRVSYSDVVSRVSPSVVKITVQVKPRRVDMNNDFPGFNDPMFRQFFGGRTPEVNPEPMSGLGSGVIISQDGYIVTNNHVVDGADSVTVALADGRELPAKVIGRDPLTDIAVVKVDAKGLPAITFADSSKILTGDRVLAIGNPFGIGETVTSGIVSATGRRVGILNDVHGYEDFIQTDAAINPGNSGGALVDVDGRLIGINTAILSRSGGFQGVGLAVPSDMVSQVADSLVRTGRVVRGFIGVNIQNITPALSESFNLKTRSGALVAEVVPDSPAAKAGIREGDVITSINGKPVSDSNSLALTVSGDGPDKKLTLDLLRDGKATTVDVTTSERPGTPRNPADALAANDDQGVLNGVAVDDLTGDARQQFNLPPHIRGALVTNVDPNSAAARAGISAGDVILEINRHPVHSAEDAVKLSEKAESKKTLLRLWSRGSTLFVVVDESGQDKSTS
jgi:serine protease Do